MSKMLVMLFLALVALVAGCPSPFNNVKLVGNSTNTTSDIIRALTAERPGGEG